MRPAYAANPITTAIFVATVLAWIAIELRQALRHRTDATNADRYSLMLVRLSGALGALTAAFALRVTATTIPFEWFVFGLGLTLMWAGIGLRWWSFHTLGRYFTFQVMTSADQPVISSGPYRYVRHPSYAGLLVALAGVGLSLGNWLCLSALVGWVGVALLLRIRVEEAALTASLGDAYTRYASTHKRLIPLLW